MRSPVLILFVLSSLTFGQDASGESKWITRRRIYPELTRTFELAGTAPTPLRALALLSIASSSKLKDLAWKRELIEESFDAAASATILWPVDPVAMREGPVPEIPKRFIKALQINSGLDRLSLQTSAITAMLTLDPPEARKLFERMSRLQVPALNCSEGLLPNVHAFYQVATVLAKSSFSAQENQKHEPVQFLQGIILSMGSPVEVEAAAQMILLQRLDPRDLVPLVNLYAQRLGAITPDNRAFFANLPAASEKVLKLADEIGGAENVSLLKAWRNYLVTNLRSARCGETVDPAFVYSRWSTRVVDQFNRDLPVDPQITVIKTEEIDFDKVVPGLDSDSVKRSPQDEEFSKRWFALMFGSQKSSLSDEKKGASEWKALFTEFLNLVESLEPGPGESSTDLIWHKCQLMAQAVIAAPPGPDRNRVLDRYISLLNVSNLTPELAPEWFSEIKTFIRLSQAFSKSGTQVSQKLRENGNSLVSLVASMNEIEAVR